MRCRTKQSILETIGCSADGKIVKSFGSKQKTAKKQLPLIVVLDEVDQVEMSHRTFIYEMFEWVSSNREDTPKKETGGIKKGSPILLIAIANALDLTERVLPRLALSSVKPELMHYKPYSASQLVDIIHDRINKVSISSIHKNFDTLIRSVLLFGNQWVVNEYMMFFIMKTIKNQSWQNMLCMSERLLQLTIEW